MATKAFVLMKGDEPDCVILDDEARANAVAEQKNKEREDDENSSDEDEITVFETTCI